MSKESKNTNSIVPHYKEGQIKKAGCKLCQSEFREEAENEYELDRNIKSAHIFLKEKKEMNISYPAVRNHLIYHYAAQENVKMLREFAEDVNGWIMMQGRKEVSLTRRIAILEREMFILAAKAEMLKGEERRKNAVVMKQLSDSILNYEDKLELANESADYLREIMLYLSQIISEEVEKIEDKEKRKEVIPIFKNIISRLKNKFGDSV